MLEGKELVLATRRFAHEVRARSWLNVATTLAVLTAAYLAVFLATPVWAKVLGSLLISLTMGRLFVIYHDHQHHAILQHSRLANWLFTVFGLYMLAPPSIWKRSHDYHHSHNSKLYTSSIGSYPIVTRRKFLEATPRERFMYLFIRHPVTIAFGYVFMFIYGMCIRSMVNNTDRHWDSIIALVFHFGIGVLMLVLGGWLVLLLGFLVPSFITMALGAYLFYAQHNFPGVVFAEKDGWTYAKAALESSSYMKMNGVMRWFLANIGFHHIHHLNSRIPFYRLPEVHRTMPELQRATTTSLHPRDIVRCLRLKVWDPDLQRMITRRELYAPASLPYGVRGKAA